MTRLWQNLGWPAFMAACVASTPLRAEPPAVAPPVTASAPAQPSSDDPKTDAKKLLQEIAALVKTVNEFRADLAAKHENLSNGQTDLQLKYQQARKEIDELNRRLGLMESRRETETVRVQKPVEEAKLDPKKLGEDLAAINKAISDLKMDLKTRHEGISAVQLDLDVKYDGVTKELDELKRQLAQMRRDMDSVRNAQTAQANGRVSNSPPNPAIPAAPATPVTPAPISEPGRVRLVNSYPYEVAVIVNQNSYRLTPGQTQLIDGIRPGTFTYQVLGVQADLQTRTLAAGETMTINVYPR